MLRTVRSGEELPLKSLTIFLENQGLIDTSDNDLKVQQFSNGFSNLTYLLNIGDKELVLRRPPQGAVKRGHDMSREYKVLSRLHPVFPKSPRAHVYCDDELVIGSPFYIMERVDGIILTAKEAFRRKIPAEAFPVIAERWLTTLVELHRVDYASVELADLGRPEGYVERQVTNWGKQYLNAATEDITEAEKLMAWMQSNQPSAYVASLIHNDYKYDNVIFADDRWQTIRAVLDWEMCTLGDPLMDLGTSLAYWFTPEDREYIVTDLPSPTLLPGNPKRSELVEKYEELTGQPIDHLVFYYAFGLFKIAVIVQQIFYRYHKGHTKDPRFATLDVAARQFCRMAWQAVQKDRIIDLI
ncbi:MAG: phosphotransferase family protein [Saprospiraceae bacterium]|nr:phosphotransferase family protein [Saprospiraceae bacterium]